MGKMWCSGRGKKEGNSFNCSSGLKVSTSEYGSRKGVKSDVTLVFECGYVIKNSI